MKVISSFYELNEINEDIVCALGTFDGVHRGHRYLIQQAMAKAAEKQAKSMVITFDKHPRRVVQPENNFELLLLPSERLKQLEQLGIDYLFILPTTPEFLQTTAEDFIHNLLEKSKIKSIYVGENFSYGKNGKGDTQLLQEQAKAYHVEVVTMPLMRSANGDIISSSLIRKLLKEGNIALANEYLGYNFGFAGEVVYGDQRGRLLGFPTANLFLPDELIAPVDGVYINRLRLNGKWYNGIGNVGDNPTFENQIHRVEVHIFNFEQNIYGENVRVEFLDFIRPEEKFSSLEELIEQMNLDKKIALNYFERSKEEHYGSSIF